jgi:uncharacterized delta-60 repeat protein
MKTTRNPNHSPRSVRASRSVLHCASLALLAAAAIGPVHAGDGDPDPEFAGQGIAVANWAAPVIADQPVAVAVAPDARVLVGASVLRDGDNRDFAISRFRSDGSIDTSFGFQGLRTAGFDYLPSGYDILRGVFPLTDGKLMLLGNAEVPDEIVARSPPAMMRLDSAGNVDPTFADEGRRVFVTTPWDNPGLYLRAVTRQPDGKFLFGGYCNNCPDTYRAVVLRVNANGEPDPTFGEAGWASMSVPSEPRLHAIAVDAEGRILLAGARLMPSATIPMVVRMTADGEADTSFGAGSNGVAVIVGLPDTLDATWNVRALAADRYGALTLAIANFSPLPVNRTGLARLDAEGSLDTSFGTSGWLELTLEDGARMETLALRSDGRIMAAGWIEHTGGGRDHYIARATRGGQLDSSFDGNGVVRIAISANSADAASSMILAAGKPLIGGYTYQTGSIDATALRMQSDLIFTDGNE